MVSQLNKGVYVGDYDGMYVMSGAWNLVTQSEEGTGQQSSTPPVIVTLSEGGTFATAEGATQMMTGRWSVKGKELTIAVYGIAKNIQRWYVGTIQESGTVVMGHIADGAIDPSWNGNFTLSMLMPQLAEEAPPKDTTRPVYEHQQFYGAWRVETWRYGNSVSPKAGGNDLSPSQELNAILDGQLIHDRSKLNKMTRRRRDSVLAAHAEKKHVASASIFDVVLHPNSTWETTSGFGEGRLAGRWNVFRDDIDLSTGIPGRGHRIWLEVRRFKTLGGRFSTGVFMTNDLLYLGRITMDLVGADEDDGAADKRGGEDEVRLAMKVSGYIAEGYQNEPSFCGQFSMSRPPGSISLE